MLKCSVNQHPCEVRDYNYANFIGREIEAQGGQMICLWLLDLSRAQPLIFAVFQLFLLKKKKNHLWDVSYSEELQKKHFSCLFIFFLSVRDMGPSAMVTLWFLHLPEFIILLKLDCCFSFCLFFHLLLKLKFPVKINMYISWWRAVMFHRMTENTLFITWKKGEVLISLVPLVISNRRQLTH